MIAMFDVNVLLTVACVEGGSERSRADRGGQAPAHPGLSVSESGE